MSMYEFKNKADKPDTLDIYIYSDIGKEWYKRTDANGNDITPDAYKSMSAEKFRKELESHENVSKINLYINSMGGSVSEGVAIYSQIKRHKAEVTAYIDGFACSIASVIPMAADKVIMSDTSMMMIHNPWTFGYGNSKELRKIADDLDKVLEGSILPAYKGKAGDKISDEKLREYIDAESYLTSKECLEYGLCDEILKSSDDEKKEEAKNKVREYVNQVDENMVNAFEKMYARAHSLPESEPKAEIPEKQAEQPEEPVPEPTDKHPEPEIKASAPENKPDEDKKAKAHEYFMKLIKGEIK